MGWRREGGWRLRGGRIHGPLLAFRQWSRSRCDLLLGGIGGGGRKGGCVEASCRSGCNWARRLTIRGRVDVPGPFLLEETETRHRDVAIGSTTSARQAQGVGRKGGGGRRARRYGGEMGSSTEQGGTGVRSRRGPESGNPSAYPLVLGYVVVGRPPTRQDQTRSDLSLPEQRAVCRCKCRREGGKSRAEGKLGNAWDRVLLVCK